MPNAFRHTSPDVRPCRVPASRSPLAKDAPVSPTAANRYFADVHASRRWPRERTPS